MTSIGETLRRERMSRNLEIVRISEDLKISTRLLEAMEADRFDKLPGGVFTKSFVRQYARYLGLDDQEIAASLQRMLEPPPVEPDVFEGKPQLVHNPELPPLKNWLSPPDSDFARSSSLRLALVVLVVLGCSAIYSLSLRNRRPAVVAAPAPSSAPVAAQTPQQPQQAPLQAPQQPPPSPAPAKLESPSPEAPRVDEANAESAERSTPAPVRVQLTAEQPVWVQATTDGKYAFSGTLEANNSRVIEANDRVFLKIGNAGGLLVWLNGKPVGRLGAEGEVRRVQFTSGGFQIVPVEAPTPGSGAEPGDSPKDPLAPL